MAMTLDGKVAIVTGGGGGIGRETVKVLVESGARVAVAEQNESAGRETVEYVGAGDAAVFVATDVSDPNSVDAMVAQTVSTFGRLDIAYNNAGIDLVGVELADVTPEQFNRIISVNLTGVYLCMRAEIRAMLPQGSGSVINTSSGLGEVGIAGQSAYVASKHGVIGLTKAAALEYSARGIRVNAILPGVIATPLIESIEQQQPGFTDALAKAHPIGRIGRPREIAEAVVWLGSDASSFVTGASLAVDGGYLAQ